MQARVNQTKVWTPRERDFRSPRFILAMLNSIISDLPLKLIIVNLETVEIQQWIPPRMIDKIIKQTILKYAQFRPSHGDIRLDAVFDEPQDRYLLMQVGWDRKRRISGDIIYITLHDGKVYIEYDGIEHGIYDDLVSQGIPEERIVLAFQPETASV